MPDLVDLEALIARLATIDYSQGSEQATREMAVNPIIGALGWDTFDPAEVSREHRVRDGRRVDYCLKIDQRPRVLIEVKSAGTDLTEHQVQLLGYAFDEGANIAALTDGLVWWLYLPGETGSPWEQRRFLSLDSLRESAADVATSLQRFLGHEATGGGTALEEARKEFRQIERDRRVRGALPEAWEKVLSDPDGLLIDLLKEAVSEISGHPPDTETVVDFLSNKLAPSTPEMRAAPQRTEGRRQRRRHSPRQEAGTAQPAPASESSRVRHTTPATPPVTSLTGRRVAAFVLDGTKHEVTSWRRLLVRLSEELSKASGSVFREEVAKVSGRRRPYFSSSASHLREPLLIPNTGLFVEGNVSAAQAERIARLTLNAVRGTDDGFDIELAE